MVSHVRLGEIVLDLAHLLRGNGGGATTLERERSGGWCEIFTCLGVVVLVVPRTLGNLNAYQCINTRSVYCTTDSYSTSRKNYAFDMSLILQPLGA